VRLAIVTPAAAGSRLGNRLTALRYARLLRSLGHSVRVRTRWDGERCDALIALHARKSHASIARFAQQHPERPIVLVLTGTDLYVDLPGDPRARAALRLADACVVLQAAARARIRRRAHVIPQSARAFPPAGHGRAFEVLVLGHLRPVKDPFRAAFAARGLPPDSRIVVRHAGRALSGALEARARSEMRRNPRYRWLGELSHARSRRQLARADLFVLSSRSEGGSLALAEALVQGVPVLASRIEANVAMLGARHPGLFAFGDTRALAGLMLRCERDPRFRARLARASRTRAARFRESRERAAWKRLLRELAGRKQKPPRSP
jgi:putative glycosyltransferase (TIGR04348 family)